MNEKYWLFYFLAFVAEIVGTVSGFGSSILFVPIASLFFDFKEVLGITAIFHVFSNITKIALFKNGINRQILIQLGIPATLSVIGGAYLSNAVNQSKLELLMSFLIPTLAIYMLFNMHKTLKANSRNLISGGLISGFLAGLIGTGGSIRGLTMAAFNLSKEVFIATSAGIDLAVDSSRAVVYYLNGYVKPSILGILPFLLLISILGSWVGKIIVGRIQEAVFKKLVLFTLILTSLVHVFRYFFSS